jgi:hypothetical protein
MARMILGALLRRNPTSVSTTNIMPSYSGFQPLDGTLIPIKRADRPEITLTWEGVTGIDLDQLLNIINSTQLDNNRDTVILYYNDNHLLEGDVVMVSASITPLPSTGAYYTESWRAAQTFIDTSANVSITVVPYEYTILRGV